MAGTRLWVQSIFVVEFLAALLLSAYMGILHNKPDDPLSILLFPPPGRAYLENHPIKDQLYGSSANGEPSFFPRTDQLNLPAAKAAVTREDVNDLYAAATFWESALQQVKLPEDYILVNPNGGNDDSASSVTEQVGDDSSTSIMLCQNPDLLQQKSSHDHIDLYICDTIDSQSSGGENYQQHQQHHNPRVVVKNGTIFFYPPLMSSSSSLNESTQHRMAVLNAIYPNVVKAASCLDSPIHFKLLVDMSASTTREKTGSIHGSAPTIHWKPWMDALNLAILRLQKEQAGGLLGHLSRSSSLSFSVEMVSDLAAAAKRRETTTTDIPSTRTSNAQIGDEELDNVTGPLNQTVSSTIHHHEITLADLFQSTDTLLPFQGTSSNGDCGNSFNIYFYLSSLPDPLLVVNDERVSSQTVALSDRAIFRILNAASTLNVQDNDDYNREQGLFILRQNEATIVLNEVIDFVTRSCLGVDVSAAPDDQQERIPASSSSPSWETDGTFPRLYRTLLFQRAYKESYEKAIAAVLTQRDLVLKTSSLVAIRDEHIAVWNAAVDHIFKAASLLTELQREEDCIMHHNNDTATCQTSRDEIMLNALDHLQQAMRLMDDMRNNADFIDRLDFPFEQYAAIFSPLALPLAIPLLIGWIREYKRYREKQTKKRTETSSSPPAAAAAAAAAQDSSKKDSCDGSSSKED